MSNDETIIISKNKYEKLLSDQLWLIALESAGVDNWEGYDYAIDIHEKLKEEEQQK